MSNYTQVTFFTPKDSLPPSNPAKTIFGSAYDVEFGNISSAIASKYDSTNISTAPIPFALGTSALPGITFVGLPSTGIFSDAGGDLGFSTAGVARLTINGTDGGITAGAPTGGDKGTGTINATGLFVNGTAVLAGGGFVSSIAGTANQIAASASTGAVTLSLPQNVIIPTPASGLALTINSVGATGGLALNSATGSAPSFATITNGGTLHGLIGTAGSVNDLVAGSAIGDFVLRSNATAIRLSVDNGASSSVAIASAGNVTIAAPSSGNTLTLNLANAGGTNALAVIVAASASGNVFTATNTAGTLTADFLANGNFEIGTVSNTQFSIYQNNATRVSINSGVQIGAPAGGDQGVGTLNATGLFVNGVAVGATSGTFTGTFTGGATAPTVTCKYTKIGTSVTVRILAGATMVSNLNTFTITGIPAAIQPATAGAGTTECIVINNSNNNAAVGSVTGGTLTFFVSTVGTFATTNFVASGTKGIGDTTLTWDTN